jgi:hypothetical protein
MTSTAKYVDRERLGLFGATKRPEAEPGMMTADPTV